MKTNFIIAIGGTGARILESYLYLLAAGLEESDAEKIMVYLVDKDLTCGNTNRLKATIDKYNKMRAVTPFELPEVVLTGFSLEPFLQELNPQYDPAVSRFCDFFTAADQPFIDLYLTKEEQYQKMDIGFAANAHLGAILIEAIFSTRAFNNEQTNPLLSDIQRYLMTNPGSPLCITMIASIFGGTGASIFPNLGTKLREKFPSANISGVLLLPYFSFPQEDVNKDKIQVKNFPEAASAALKYYGTLPTFVKKSDFDNANFTFNALYLSGGLPMEDSCDSYEIGGYQQKHRFLPADMIGALNVIASFAEPNPASGGSANVFTYSLGAKECLDAGIFPHGKAEKLIAFTEFASCVRSCVFPWVYREDALSTYQLTTPFGHTWNPLAPKAKVDINLLRSYVSDTAGFCEDFFEYMVNLHSAQNPLVLLNGDVLRNQHRFLGAYTNANAGANSEHILAEIGKNGNYALTANTPAPGKYMDFWISTRPKAKTPLEIYKKILSNLYNKTA